MIQLKPGVRKNSLKTSQPSSRRRASSKQQGIKFKRVFSTENVSPFDQVEWENRTAEITDDGGKAIFKQENVAVPKSWSPLATKIAVSKYFYGDISHGTDPYKGGRENSVRQLVHRVTRTISDWGIQDGYFADTKSAEVFYDDLTWLCLNQHGAFNSPVWFNVGLYHQYGVGKNSGKGNYFYNRATGESERAPTQYEYPQGSACFIQSVKDSMEDIMRLATSEAMLFKYGSGSGSDLSTLRSTREKLSGGGKPSGPLSFLKIYDQIAGTIKSGGKTRRAAKMNTLKDWHPDIEEFIEAKQNEEKKAWALIEQGYDGDFNGEAYGSVMYQNENLSVRVSDEFMEAASEGREWLTRRVTDGKICEKKDARTLLRKIAEGTHICGDPGMQFDSTIHKWHTCKGTDRQNSTNPCSEYLFLDNTACNLASLNLMKFKSADGLFDIERFKAAVRVFITAQEILVDNASYPVKEIADNSHIFRTLGLGYANLGSLIMSYGLGYDSDEGRALAGAITAIMTGHAYEQSAELAKAMGPFAGYKDARCTGVDKPVSKDNVASMLEVIEQHLAAVEDIHPSAKFGYLKENALQAWENALVLGRKHGYRNAQVTVLAPTGTIGFLMDCDTTGIEPDIALVKYKLLAGGGMLKIVNQTVRSALKDLGYGTEVIEQIIAHIDRFDTIENVKDEQTGKLVPSGLKEEHINVFDCAFKARLGHRSLHYKGHIKMMAAAQPFLSGAISKTVNLPSTATVEDIMNTYMEGWKLGLKAIAIYRDSSKRSAPLATDKKQHGSTNGFTEMEAELSGKAELESRVVELNQELEDLRVKVNQPLRHRLPDTRVAINHKFDIAGHEGYLTVGLFENGQPGELFITMAKEGSTIGGLMDTIGTLTSIALQYGVPLSALVKKFAYQRFEPSGFTRNPDIRNATSIADYVFRWLGCQFIKGYKEATSPNANSHQPDLPMKGITEMEKRAVNRPVADLPRTGEKEVIDVIGHEGASEGEPHIQSNGHNTHAERVQKALGDMYMDTPCSNCGSHKVIRAGACGCCTECGTSQGCS